MSPSGPHPLYPNLLSPIAVGRHRLRNRVLMGSMHTRLEHEAESVAKRAAFYRERAEGGVAMIVTGGFAPDEAGRLEEGGPILARPEEAASLAPIAAAVQEAGAKILLQILHAGRYAKHDRLVAPSAIASPINPRTPRALSSAEVEETIDNFVRAAELAQGAGFDGVEIMGSEGYLINEFTAPRTNRREDEWGGSLENRIRFPVEIVRRIRARLGAGFILMHRISALDLVEEGSTGEEIDALARAIEAAGASLLSTGIGWHEARVPTIAYMVPRAAWRFAAARLKRAVAIPVVAANRINSPELAEEILAAGEADCVSLARPLLAEPEFVAKARECRAERIAPCIACNEGCLDWIFADKVASCLVNPRACRESEFPVAAAARPLKLAVVGSGPAGLSAARTAALRGHAVTLFEAGNGIGGQLDLARRIPGKEEYGDLVRYFAAELKRLGVELRFATRATAALLKEGGFDRVVIATGVLPRRPQIPGLDHKSVASYEDIVKGRVAAGRSVAIIGAGGIGVDVALLLSEGEERSAEEFYAFWGVDRAIAERGGLRACEERPGAREITMLHRGRGRPGAGLGRSTAWTLRLLLERRGVRVLGGCSYRFIDDDGLHFAIGGEEHLLAAETIVLCAGQEPLSSLGPPLEEAGIACHLIGGARDTLELDALGAIEEGMRVAYGL
jgi:2,4-dienoyl-CoA reductase (NADPH2)